MKRFLFILLFLCLFVSGCKSKPCTGEHVDADGNGLCDKCRQSVIVTVDFYVINDLHGKFDDSGSQPGVDELTTYLKEVSMVEENTVFLSSGDMWQGSSESNLTKGKIIIDWMQELNFVSMTLGNHEFDWGEEILSENAEYSEIPFLGINVYDTDTNARVSYCEPSVMIERGGAKIGIIGAVGDCYSSISADKTRGLYFVTGSALTELVKEEALKLRAEGADYIVYSLHDGYENSNSGPKVVIDRKLESFYSPELSNGYVDLVFEGHTHQSYVLIDSHGVYHIQDGGENKGISRVEVLVNTASDNDKVSEIEVVPSTYYAKKGSDSLRDELIQKYVDKIGPSREILGNNPYFLSSDELGDLVAKLYYEFGEKQWGDKYDIVLGGGFLSTRNPYSLDAGGVTYSKLQSLFPFDNELVLCSIKGSDIKYVFFENSNTSYHSYYGDYGASVKASIDPNATYYVVVDTYTSLYQPNHLTEIERLGREYYSRDLLADYFRQ